MYLNYQTIAFAFFKLYDEEITLHWLKK